MITTEKPFVNSFFGHFYIFHLYSFKSEYLYTTLLPITSDSQHRLVIHVAYFDAGTLGTCMNDLVVAYVDSYVIIVTDHISRKLVHITDSRSSIS